jgi:ornithine cyclodeaminase
MTAPEFAVIPGALVHEVLCGSEREVTRLVEDAYLRHDEGGSVNPPSYFLRFPDRPDSRIIALPASLGGPGGVDGLKWISSFPGNVSAGLPRASAVLILNDPGTGYPIACLEGSIISATRTAALAASAADRLSRGRHRPTRIGFVGAGLIARYVHTFLVADGWEFEAVGIHDLSAASAAGLTGHVARAGGTVTVHESAEHLVRASDLVVFATVAGAPYVHEVDWFAHHPLVLHLSLRDLDPAVVLAATNIVDDVDHCLRADTSPHLAEQVTGDRSFVSGTLADVMTGRLSVPNGRPVIFSPFGLGVLDLAVGRYVYERIAESGRLDVVPGFFHDLRRHG